MRWREFFVPNGVGGEPVARCPLTLSGSFHSATVVKTAGLLVGYVTSAQMATCTNGSATILPATLPWHLTYTGFSGILPAISGVRLSMTGFSIAIFIQALQGTCLARTTTREPLALDFARETGSGAITVVRAGEFSSIGADCGFNVKFAGSATLEQGTGRSVTVTLI